MSCVVEGGYDAGRLGTLVVTITETGGGGHARTVTLPDTYMPTQSVADTAGTDDNGVDTHPFTGRYVSMVALLNGASGFNNGSLTSAITVAIAGGHWRFSSNGAGGVTAIAVTYNAAANLYFGALNNIYAGANTQTFSGFASRYMECVVGGVTELTPPHETADNLATDLLADDGGVESIVQSGALHEMECVVPLEPADRVWHPVGIDPNDRTWEIFFRQVRSLEPITIALDDGLNAITYVGQLKADACVFQPELLSAEYLAYANIRLRMWWFGNVSP